MTIVDEYWNKFIKDTGRSEDDRCAGDLCFEANGFVGDEELYVVLDRNDSPRCIIEIQDVNVIPFNEITWGMAQKEGEDENLEDWRDKKREYLEDEGHIVGFDFTPDIKLVFQTFKVIYR